MSLRTMGIFQLFLIISGITGLTAQSLDSQNIRVKPAPDMGHICTFEPTNINANHFIRHRDIAGKLPSWQTTSEFNVTYENLCNGDVWPQEAINAFEFAIGIWETHLQSNVPVRVEATWQELDAITLGSAGPSLIAQVPAPIGQNDTWYAVAQASAMTGIDIIATSNENYDIEIRINCARNDWYFGTDANTPPNRIDFVTVVLHEIGHGVGFIGSVRANQQVEIADWGIESNAGNVYPIIYDRFVEDGDGIFMLNETVYPNNSTALYEAVTGQNDGLWFAGPEASIVNNGLPVQLYAPYPWDSGSSYSHLDQATYTQTENALMRPRIDFESAIHTPGPVFCGMLYDMGWPLGSNCFDLIGVESAIAVDVTALDFGVNDVETVITRTFTIENLPTAEDPLAGRLVIDDQNFSISPNQQRFSIEPGNSIEVSVQYDPLNIGQHETQLLIFHNSVEQPSPLRIQLRAEALEGIFVMDQNYPNPFSHTTQIEYAITGTSDVRLDVYNTAGQLISTLVNEIQAEGRYEIEFNAANLVSGMYLYRIIVDGRADTRKFLHVK